MTQRSGWRPEHTLMAATLVFVGSLLVAVALVVAGVMQGRRIEEMIPYGVAVVAVGGVAAFVINAYGNKLRRSQRPEWLETQAWRSGLQEKLEKGRARDVRGAETAANEPAVKPGSEKDPGPRKS